MPTALRRPTLRSLAGWAAATLREAGAIVECEEHGWMLERGDPDALARARDVARDDPPQGSCSSEALAAIEEALAGTGDNCPECSPPCEPEELPRFK